MDNNLYRRKLNKIYNHIDKLALKGKDNILEYYKYIDELISKGDYSSLEEVLSIYYQIDIVNFSDVNQVKKKTWNDICFLTSSSFLKKLSKLYKQKNVYQSSYDIYTNYVLCQISMSDQLTGNFSYTSTTASIHISQQNSLINLTTYDNNIYNVKIFKSNWINDLPTNIDIIQNINTGTQSIYATNIPTTYAGEYLITTYQRTAYPNLADFKIINYRLNIEREPLLGKIIEMDNYGEDINYLVKNKQYARIIGERKTFLEVTKIGATSSIIIDSDNSSLTEEQNLLNRYKTAINILLS